MTPWSLLSFQAGCPGVRPEIRSIVLTAGPAKVSCRSVWACWAGTADSGHRAHLPSQAGRGPSTLFLGTHIGIILGGPWRGCGLSLALSLEVLVRTNHTGPCLKTWFREATFRCHDICNVVD